MSVWRRVPSRHGRAFCRYVRRLGDRVHYYESGGYMDIFVWTVTQGELT